MMTQPLHSLASLSLFRATPAQALESRKRTWPQWGGPLSEEDYLARDEKLKTMKHPKWTPWVLAPRDSPDTLDFACACETYKRTGLVRYSGSSETREAPCYGVAYVFTPPDKRGKGFASHMMRLLHWVIARRTPGSNLHHDRFPEEWGAPPEINGGGDGLFSILYSGVGDRFYKETGPGVEAVGGWEPRHSFSTTWQIPERGEIEQDIAGDNWRLLKHGDLDSLWAKDIQLTRRVVEDLPTSHPGYYIEGPTAFVAFVTCLPDEDVGTFHMFCPMFALGDIVPMEIWGIEKEGDPETYATWVVDATSKTLHPELFITRLNATDADFTALIKRIKEIARKSGIWKMEAWNIPSHLLGGVAKTGGETFAREKRISAIKWYGEEETANVEWVFNERFCWC